MIFELFEICCDLFCWLFLTVLQRNIDDVGANIKHKHNVYVCCEEIHTINDNVCVDC